MSKLAQKNVIGWREWVGLPGLGIDRVKAKIDTGACSSSLHAFNVRIRERGGRTYVHFSVHPLQRDTRTTVECRAEVLEYRVVRSSSGHTQRRPVIRTTLHVLGETWPIELTLANRDEMGFRMLLGREGIRRRFLVDAGKSFYGGRPEKSQNKKAGLRTSELMRRRLKTKTTRRKSG